MADIDLVVFKTRPSASPISIMPIIMFTKSGLDVRPYYAISNALAFPSYREGFPNVVDYVLKNSSENENRKIVLSLINHFNSIFV